MLLNGHHLNAVITILDNAWQHIILKLLIGTNLLCILSHTYMALVNEQGILLGFEVLFLELVFLLRIPNLSRENLCILVLNHTTAPSGNTLAFSPIPLYLHLVKLTVFQGLFAEFQLPVARTLDTLATVLLVLLPVIKVANQIDIGSVRSPLTEHPTL